MENAAGNFGSVSRREGNIKNSFVILTRFRVCRQYKSPGQGAFVYLHIIYYEYNETLIAHTEMYKKEFTPQKMQDVVPSCVI